jgi:hypothetical protein
VSIWFINSFSRPTIDASYQTHWATNVCWVLLANAITFSKA